MNGLPFHRPDVLFKDRRQAGRALATRLKPYQASDGARAVILALPRGGLPVAYEVSRALRAPLDVFLVRKLGLPSRPELAMGAIASGGVRVVNEELVRALQVPEAVVDRVASGETRELERREQLYRGGRPPVALEGRTVLLVDDGLATGATMRAAVRAVRRRSPARVVVAVPLASPETCALLRAEADDVVCAFMPEPFLAVGLWYDDFEPTTDEEVVDLLAEGRGRETPTPSAR
jgi:predicted phosphoribosyltransferase